jgi:hypothetical protein
MLEECTLRSEMRMSIWQATLTCVSAAVEPCRHCGARRCSHMGKERVDNLGLACVLNDTIDYREWTLLLPLVSL